MTEKREFLRKISFRPNRIFYMVVIQKLITCSISFPSSIYRENSKRYYKKNFNLDQICLALSKYLNILYKVPHMHNFFLLAFEVQILTKIRQNYEYLQIIFLTSTPPPNVQQNGTHLPTFFLLAFIYCGINRNFVLEKHVEKSIKKSRPAYFGGGFLSIVPSVLGQNSQCTMHGGSAVGSKSKISNDVGIFKPFTKDNISCSLARVVLKLHNVTQTKPLDAEISNIIRDIQRRVTIVLLRNEIQNKEKSNGIETFGNGRMKKRENCKKKKTKKKK
ncbi:hypothetical protein AGLY_011249 [Aphis glycines]|uniref:Uncharacterized protein n=1 Tax=Aphis glycines TaxID=307491 RepID=A0A6G0TF49_APHGL|nr:hypothetical protein AGLY_011249 [Aphis glycines]